VVGVYTDNDVSASKGKARPAYRRLLDDLAAGVADAVIVWDLDRLHRRPKELEEFLELADQHHIALASVGGDVDLASPQGRLVARIKAGPAGGLRPPSGPAATRWSPGTGLTLKPSRYPERPGCALCPPAVLSSQVNSVPWQESA
jgi:Resolvase, N terminal domain